MERKQQFISSNVYKSVYRALQENIPLLWVALTEKWTQPQIKGGAPLVYLQNKLEFLLAAI